MAGNQSAFGMLMGDPSMSISNEEVPVIEANTFWEYFEITDSEEQREYFHAFQRLFGNCGYWGDAGRWNETILLFLKEDGSVWIKYTNEDGPNDKEAYDEEDALGEGSGAKDDSPAGNYQRKYVLTHNMRRFQENLEAEIEGHKRIVKQLDFETDGDSMLSIEEGLMMALSHYTGETRTQLSKIDERVVTLLPFVEQDSEDFLALLGIDDLKDELQVRKAFSTAVRKKGGHPDLLPKDATEVEKAVAGAILNELKRAKDELLMILKRGQESKGKPQVSSYIGGISALLEKEDLIVEE